MLNCPGFIIGVNDSGHKHTQHTPNAHVHTHTHREHTHMQLHVQCHTHTASCTYTHTHALPQDHRNLSNSYPSIFEVSQLRHRQTLDRMLHHAPHPTPVTTLPTSYATNLVAPILYMMRKGMPSCRNTKQIHNQCTSPDLWLSNMHEASSFLHVLQDTVQKSHSTI
jgi:hypothetical protein